MDKLNFIDCKAPKYAYTGQFFEGMASVQDYDGLNGFINLDGEEVISCQYQAANEFSSGLVSVQNSDGLWGYINKEGKKVIDFKYKYAGYFSKDLTINLAPVITDHNTWIYINKNGEQAINHTFALAESFSDGYALVRTFYSSEYYYLTPTGNLHGPYKQANRFVNGLALVADNKNVYIINKNFEIISKRSLDTLEHVSTNYNDLYIFRDKKGKTGYLDKKLNEKNVPIFQDGHNFCDDMAIVNLSDDFIGIINPEGKIIVFSKDYQYRTIHDFKEGLSVVINPQCLFGYINKEGKEAIACQFKDADNFREGLAGVEDIDGNFYYIDKFGNIKLRIDTIYSSILELDDKTIYISATTEEELQEKKLQVLKLVKEELIAKIDNLAYDHTDGLYQHTRVRKLSNNTVNK